MARLFDDLNNPRLSDLVGTAGPIVSDPVKAVISEPMFTAESLEDDAWRAAYVAFPMHWSADGSVPQCCLEADGLCEASRALFVDSYITSIVGPEVAQAAQAVDLDMMVDPVHALADDHIRLAKPNRTRYHK